MTEEDLEVAPPAIPKKKTLKERLAAHTAEYGKIAIYTYLALSLMTITAFSIAIGAGIEPSSATGVLGVIGAGWLAAKATMPIRILITLGITPLIAAVINRIKARKTVKSPKSEPDATGASASERAS